MASTTTTAALTLARLCLEQGLPVFPVALKYTKDGIRKVPVTEHGHKDASRDPVTVADWFLTNPFAHVGVPTGEVSGLYVLDQDSPDAPVQEMLGKEWYAVPSIPTSRPGGRHFYLSAPIDGEPLRNCVDRDLKLDFRGDGGFVVMWSEPPAPPYPPVPPKVAEWCRAGRPTDFAPSYEGPADPDWGQQTLAREVERVRSALPGAFNDTFFRAACAVMRAINGGHLDPDDSISALIQARQSVDPDAQEMTTTILSAARATREQSSGPDPDLDMAQALADSITRAAGGRL